MSYAPKLFSRHALLLKDEGTSFERGNEVEPLGNWPAILVHQVFDN
jgi:hypothetical protein